MANARRQLNATLLPDGKVLVTGGSSGPGFDDSSNPVFPAEIWDPATKMWSTMASLSVLRGYHSTAVLLPDGRVLSAGGGQFSQFPPASPSAEIYSPPYLFRGPRPTISSISICAMQGEHLAGLQELLGDRLGKEVNIISISSDPQTDTPERLKNWAARFKAKTGWTIVTGGTAEIDRLAKAFTKAGSSKGMHSPIVYLGNDKKGVWFHAYGLVGPSRWVELMAEVSR